MTIELSLITDVAELGALHDDWLELAEKSENGTLFRGPGWLIPWWHAYHQVLHAELYVIAAREEDRLVALAPLYARNAWGAPGLEVREIRLLGDAGPRPPALGFLVVEGYEERVGVAFARFLQERHSEWDVLDLEPMVDPSPVRATMVAWLANADYQVKSKRAGGARRIALAVAGIDVEGEMAIDERASAYFDDDAALRKGLSALKRLSRLEWADREERSPLADDEAAQLLEEVTLRLGREGRARLARLDDSSGEAVAAALVIDDQDRAVVIAMAVDPQQTDRHASMRLLAAEARAATERGRVSLDVVMGAVAYEFPSLPTNLRRALGLRVYSTTKSAALARTYGAVRRRVEAAREAPGAAAASARAAWAKIRTAAARMAHYDRWHLYRGELWTQGVAPTAGLEISIFEDSDLAELAPRDRDELLETLELDEAYCLDKWRRGDLVILARLFGRPAGIAWCARDEFHIPELERTIELEPSETYIHDVFVAPAARGRAVAPSMLEFLSHELRQRDVYRSWALIGSDNTASVRAFQKAAYAAVADVIRAQIGNVDRLVVRPPDPAAKKLLGIVRDS